MSVPSASDRLKSMTKGSRLVEETKSVPCIFCHEETSGLKVNETLHREGQSPDPRSRTHYHCTKLWLDLPEAQGWRTVDTDELWLGCFWSQCDKDAHKSPPDETRFIPVNNKDTDKPEYFIAYCGLHFSKLSSTYQRKALTFEAVHGPLVEKAKLRRQEFEEQRSTTAVGCGSRNDRISMHGEAAQSAAHTALQQGPSTPQSRFSRSPSPHSPLPSEPTHRHGVNEQTRLVTDSGGHHLGPQQPHADSDVSPAVLSDTAPSFDLATSDDGVDDSDPPGTRSKWRKGLSCCHPH